MLTTELLLLLFVHPTVARDRVEGVGHPELGLVVAHFGGSEDPQLIERRLQLLNKNLC